MELTGKQKAAMLLKNLDAETAGKLLDGLPVDDIQDIGIELARIETSGQQDSKEAAKIAREFCEHLQKQTASLGIRSFLNEILVRVVGKDKAEHIQAQIKKVTEKKDLFAEIRAAATTQLVLALEGEHQQTIAVVLSELPPKKSQEVLEHLDDSARVKAIRKMTTLEKLGADVRRRIASMVSERLKIFEGETLPEDRKQTLRRLAIILGGLERELRDQLLDGIKQHDEETCTMVRNLMITWEDISTVADRSLQEALRSVEPSKLAIALYGADEEIAAKIRSNISERVVAMVDEEVSLMQEPLEKEILDAREEVVKPLREANEEGTLRRSQS